MCMLLVCLAVCGCGSPVVTDDGKPATTEEVGTQETGPAEEGEPADGQQEPSDGEEQASFDEREVPLITSDEASPKTMALRFYDACPSVPYLGIAQYLGTVFEEEVQVDSDGSRATLTSADGGTLVAEEGADTLTSESWLAFRNYIEPMRQGKTSGFIDFGVQFVRLDGIDYERQTEPVVFDLGSYGIDVHVDEKDVYVPLATASDILADVAMNSLSYNGEEVVLSKGFGEYVLSLDRRYYDPIVRSSRREQDMVDFSYAELCFAIDTLYGRTGTGVLDDELATSRLDEVLRTHDDNTRSVRDLLLSQDKADYLAGMQCLNLYLNDQHTQLDDSQFKMSYGDNDIVTRSEEVCEALSDKIMATREMADVGSRFKLNHALEQARDAAFSGPDHYHELGDTAMISLDSFMSIDRSAWDRYYEGKGERPDGTGMPDVIGTLADGLERANANPEIRNVVIDITMNMGGSNDLCACAVALVCGDDKMPVRDRVSGLMYSLDYNIDSLFDGSFATDAAAYARRDLNYAVLTSSRSFSCGNLFPSRLRDAGIPIIGERSSGGTDMCERMVTPEGFQMQLAGAAFEMCNDAGEPIEDGVPVDVDLVQYDSRGEADYRFFYDLGHLSQVMAGIYGGDVVDQAA